VGTGRGACPVLSRTVTQPPPRLRALFVHAHPDDESLGTGTTMARYAAAPDTDVTLVTCTLGEEGEILLPEVAHLAADRADRLGPHRQQELAAAMGALGVKDWRLLGGPGRYRDSGMMGTPANSRVDCFWRADLLEAASHLVEVIREVRPAVLVTYDPDGGYGHPDHIQAHRVAMYAVMLAEAPTFRPDLGAAHVIAKVYWVSHPQADLTQVRETLRGAGTGDVPSSAVLTYLALTCTDALATASIPGSDALNAKVEALRAHASQIQLDEGFLSLLGGDPRVVASECFRLVRGLPGGPLDDSGRETDLFGGLRS
jgi:N-acetyl-1-D-myo-inositol-2-amino-2-deoxy-alpha-D-glucopyranoside deacetylase